MVECVWLQVSFHSHSPKAFVKAHITHALLRGTRFDRLAEAAFKLVRADLNLWVRELPEDLDEMVRDLAAIRPLLRELGAGNPGFTLHLVAEIDETRALTLPPELCGLAGECGFAIEVFASEEDFLIRGFRG